MGQWHFPLGGMTALLWAGGSNKQPPGGPANPHFQDLVIHPLAKEVLWIWPLKWVSLKVSRWQLLNRSCCWPELWWCIFDSCSTLRTKSILYLKIKYNLWSICKFIQYTQNIFFPLPKCTLFKFTIWTSTSCIIKSEKETIKMKIIVLSIAI